MIYCFEVAPSTGTPHLHVYMEFKEKQSWSVIRAMILLLLRPSCEDKSQAKAIDYCKKDGNFVERGQKKNQGSRSDLDGARVMALECGMREVTRHCSAQQISVAKSFLTYNEEPRDSKLSAYGYGGPLVVGKPVRLTNWPRLMAVMSI